MTDFFFVAFALVFFATRLIVFPFHVYLNNSVRPRLFARSIATRASIASVY